MHIRLIPRARRVVLRSGQLINQLLVERGGEVILHAHTTLSPIRLKRPGQEV
jgi:hypothetical protein